MTAWSTTSSSQNKNTQADREGASLELRDVSLTYDDGEVIEAVRDVSFELGPGVSCALIGPSGCGKSTLLYLLAGLRQATSGDVSINNRPLAGPRRDTSLILQDYGLLPWKTLHENVSLGLEIRRVRMAERRELTDHWLHKLGLWSVRNLFPNQLSGGQRQRTAVARSLVLDPDLLLMDEPFSSLDALTREKLQEELLELIRETGLTLVIVTHSIDEAVLLGQRIVVLSDRPGKVVANVKNEGWGTPNYRRTRQFFEYGARLRSVLSGDHGREAEE